MVVSASRAGVEAGSTIHRVTAVGDKLDAFISGSMTDKDGFPLSDDFDETGSEDGNQRENSDVEREKVAVNFG